CVALRAQLAAVGLVTVAAGHARCIHSALEKRAPVVDLVALLAVGVINRIGEKRRPVVIEERLACRGTVGELTAPPNTLRANVDLAIGRARLRSRRRGALAVARPGYAAPLVEARGEAFRSVRVGVFSVAR